MTSYLEGLGKQTDVGDVFYDLFDSADEIASEFAHRIERLYGSAEIRQIVPGTDLILRQAMWSGGRTPVKQEVFANWKGNWNPLFAIQRNHTAAADPFPYRETIRGFRGTETSGDFLLSETRPGVIVCELGKTGLRDPDPDHEFGISAMDKTTRIEELGDKDKTRLDSVAQGVMDCIAAVELMSDGVPALEVLETMGRPMRVAR